MLFSSLACWKTQNQIYDPDLIVELNRFPWPSPPCLAPSPLKPGLPLLLNLNGMTSPMGFNCMCECRGARHKQKTQERKLPIGDEL